MSDSVNAIPAELSETLDKWAKITIFQLKKSIAEKGVGLSKNSTKALFRSFEYRLERGANGMPSRVTIGFLYHGKFVDMGVGRGQRVGEYAVNRENFSNAYKNASKAARSKLKKPRRAVKWYSPTMYHEYQRAAEILAGKYAIEIPPVFENLLNDKVTVKI